MKQTLQDWQPQYKAQELPSIQTALCGLIAGAAGPMSNAPVDTLSESIHPIPPVPSQYPSKTNTQTTPKINPTPPPHSSLSHTVAVARTLFRQEGIKALYKGITPRIMRIAPGQAITYTIYEQLKVKLT